MFQGTMLLLEHAQDAILLFRAYFGRGLADLGASMQTETAAGRDVTAEV